MQFIIDDNDMNEIIDYLIDYYHILDKEKDRTRRQVIVQMLHNLSGMYKNRMKKLKSVFDEVEKYNEDVFNATYRFKM